MISAQQAQDLILHLVHPLDPARDTEQVPLQTALTRILADSVVSPLDFPHWDNSAMDGYAVRFADVQQCSEAEPVILEVVEEIPAGSLPQKTVQPGQAARILTGSMMPAGADTVVMQENTRLVQPDETAENSRLPRVAILAPPRAQSFVRRRGEYYQAGAPLLPAGLLIGAAEIAVLAAAQCTQVPVYRRPRVAILSTGSELVAPDQPLQPGQIVDSNQYALAALVAQTGAEPLCLGVVPDQPGPLRRAIAQALQTADLVISSGGVSVGDYDYVEQVLTDLGGTLHIRSVAVKPGKPLTVASFSAIAPTDIPSPAPLLYFGLPGNPVSALVSYWRFVQPAIRKLSGLPHSWGPLWVRGRAIAPLQSDGKRETYFWGQLRLQSQEYEFHLSIGSHSSGNLINLAQTNALARLALGQTSVAAGEEVEILQVAPPLTLAEA